MEMFDGKIVHLVNTCDKLIKDVADEIGTFEYLRHVLIQLSGMAKSLRKIKKSVLKREFAMGELRYPYGIRFGARCKLIEKKKKLIARKITRVKIFP